MRERKRKRDGETIDIMPNIPEVNKKMGQSTSGRGVGGDSEGVIE